MQSIKVYILQFLSKQNDEIKLRNVKYGKPFRKLRNFFVTVQNHVDRHDLVILFIFVFENYVFN